MDHCENYIAMGVPNFTHPLKIRDPINFLKKFFHIQDHKLYIDPCSNFQAKILSGYC